MTTTTTTTISATAGKPTNNHNDNNLRRIHQECQTLNNEAVEQSLWQGQTERAMVQLRTAVREMRKWVRTSEEKPQDVTGNSKRTLVLNCVSVALPKSALSLPEQDEASLDTRLVFLPRAFVIKEEEGEHEARQHQEDQGSDRRAPQEEQEEAAPEQSEALPSGCAGSSERVSAVLFYNMGVAQHLQALQCRRTSNNDKPTRRRSSSTATALQRQCLQRALHFYQWSLTTLALLEQQPRETDDEDHTHCYSHGILSLLLTLWNNTGHALEILQTSTNNSNGRIQVCVDNMAAVMEGRALVSHPRMHLSPGEYDDFHRTVLLARLLHRRHSAAAA